jgi:hypothetical protein
LNPGRRGGKPATNRLSYGAAMSEVFDEATFYKQNMLHVFRSSHPGGFYGQFPL